MPGEPIECPQSWLDWQLYLWRDWDGEDDTCDLSESDCFWRETYERGSKIYIEDEDIVYRKDGSNHQEDEKHCLGNKDTWNT